jgi:pimeloyl-ACP methyl ester carboxylesterase/predicted glycosyltransferase
MRAIEPTHEGDVVRDDGVRIHYYVHGAGEHTILLMPTWSLLHARHWKGQLAYLGRHFRVVSFDGRGNGRSDRPRGPAAYSDDAFVGDAVAVLDATGTGQAVVAGLSLGGHWSALLAALHPERVAGAVLVCPAAPFGPRHAARAAVRFDARLEAYEGWDKYNLHHWRASYRDFVEFFVGKIFSEPHSSKQIEDAIGWALETDGELLADTARGSGSARGDGEALYRRVRCPTLVISGDQDEVVHPGVHAAVAEATGGELLTIEGGGHAPNAREPVLVNRLIKDFADRVWGLRPRQRRSPRWSQRPRRVLYLSSPIGLGHARRDLAVARALRELRPGIEIDWLSQDPVTRFLAAEGERLHPACRLLGSESAHVEGECGEHDLHVFQALRDMDEIMVANFTVFQEAVEEGHYDLVVADEAWEVDHFWHEHPELKRAPLAWLTDFVGYLPFADGGDRERRLTADYNAEMIGHVERFPWVRDRALFVGDPEDIVADRFGTDLPAIRDWTERHFRFTGYIGGLDLGALGERAALRAELGYRPDEQVCVVSVGGSAVGEPLLRRLIEAAPLARRQLPGLRMVVVAGPRIDPARLPAPPGVEVRGFVPDLPRHLACCDLGVVQGGLTTCMELAAARTPFLYLPLAHHFEQCFHVDHRLRRHGAGRRLDYGSIDADGIAAAMDEELRRPSLARAVSTDGAPRAAALLAEML